MNFQSIASDLTPIITSLKDPFTLAAAGIGALVLGAVSKYVLSSAIKYSHAEMAARASGMKLARSNATSIIDHSIVVQAVHNAFENNDQLEHVFIELSEMAIIAKRGDEEPVILDFTKPEDEMTDAILYTQIKEKMGNDNPEEIFEFAKAGLPYEVSEIFDLEKSELDEVDAHRIYEHAAMKCSWARDMSGNAEARQEITKAFTTLLAALAANNNASRPPSNLSRKGVFAVSWESGEGVAKHVFIKPRTRTERALFKEEFGTRRANFNDQGQPLTGKQALDNYATVKAKQKENDRDEVSKKLNRWNFITRYFV